MSVRVLIGPVLLCLVAAGCSSTVSGNARFPAGVAAPATSAALAPPTSLPPRDAKTVLLKRSEMGEIIGVADAKEVDDYSDVARPSGIEPSYACPSRFVPNASSAFYNGTDDTRKAMQGNGVTGGGRFATQIVAVFDTARTVDVSMTAVSGDWRESCGDGTQITLTNNDQSQTWTAGPVEPPVNTWTNPRDIDRISTTSRREQPNARVCAGVMASQGTVLVSSMACGPDDSAIAQASTIADRITAKLPK